MFNFFKGEHGSLVIRDSYDLNDIPISRDGVAEEEGVESELLHVKESAGFDAEVGSLVASAMMRTSDTCFVCVRVGHYYTP